MAEWLNLDLTPEWKHCSRSPKPCLVASGVGSDILKHYRLAPAPAFPELSPNRMYLVQASLFCSKWPTKSHCVWLAAVELRDDFSDALAINKKTKNFKKSVFPGTYLLFWIVDFGVSAPHPAQFLDHYPSFV